MAQPFPALAVETPMRDDRMNSVFGVPAAYPPAARFDAQSGSQRTWMQLCLLGQGASATVWLCDWSAHLPPDATPLGPNNALTRRGSTRLVALKRMTRPWYGSLKSFRHIKEVESLLHIPRHENIVNLYDCFFSPATCELFMVFEFMEGDLHQLLERRRMAGHALAEGLVRSIFAQMVTGLHHVHGSGYMHRDLKPENVLVSTTGFSNYPSSRLVSDASDLTVAVKIADFGLARETASSRPRTDYVATRWYRAPEVLLRDSSYSLPMDIWALGLILVELVNLEPLFPGRGELDQLNRIGIVLGYPSRRFCTDSRGRLTGGGPWPAGIRMAESLGFFFRKCWPMSLYRVLKTSVPRNLVECVEHMLRYDPQYRLTTRSLLQHSYLSIMGNIPA